MRYMQILPANDIDGARREYLAKLASHGVALAPRTEIYTEPIRRMAPVGSQPTWLCYVGQPQAYAA